MKRLTVLATLALLAACGSEPTSLPLSDDLAVEPSFSMGGNGVGVTFFDAPFAGIFNEVNGEGVCWSFFLDGQDINDFLRVHKSGRAFVHVAEQPGLVRWSEGYVSIPNVGVFPTGATYEGEGNWSLNAAVPFGSGGLTWSVTGQVATPDGSMRLKCVFDIEEETNFIRLR